MNGAWARSSYGRISVLQVQEMMRSVAVCALDETGFRLWSRWLKMLARTLHEGNVGTFLVAEGSALGYTR